MNKKDKNPNVPNLRFKSNSHWKVDILDNLCQFYKGNGISKNDLSNDGCSCILYGQLYTTYLNEIVSKVVSKTNIKLDNPFYSKINDLIIPSSGEDPIDIAVARSIQIDNVLLGGDLNVLRPNKDVNSSFLSYQLNGKRKFDIARIAQGKSIVHLHNSDLKKIKIYYPNIKEQNKIVSLLYKIDKRIETQIKIIDDLILQKKYITSKLLNELLTNDFVFLSEIISDYNIRTTRNNAYPVLSSTSSGIYFQSDYFNKEASSSDTTGYKIVPRGYCTYRSMSDTGIFNFNIQNICDKGIVSPSYPVFTSSDYFNDFIVLYLNNSLDIKKQTLELKSGGTRFSLSFSTLGTLKIPSICKEKQLSIIKTITAFETKIRNEKAIYYNIKKQKQFLLRNLFI